MAKEEQLIHLRQQGVEEWNRWRQQSPFVRLDFSGARLNGENLAGAELDEANLSEANLSGADLTDADLSRADLSKADLTRTIFLRTDLSKANLSEANLFGANLSEAKLSEAELHEANLTCAELDGANLSEANLSGANLDRTNLSGADLSEAFLTKAKLTRTNLHKADLSGAELTEADLYRADLTEANLTGTNLVGARLRGCGIYGISAWDLKLSNETRQLGLTIRDTVAETADSFTVNDIEVAQFIYLLHNRKKSEQIERIRQVMAAIDLRTADIVNSGATVLDAPSNNAGVKLQIEETNAMDQTDEVGQNSAQSVDEHKKSMRSAMAEMDPKARKEVIDDLESTFRPSQPVMDRIWQLIVGAFVIVFVISAIALCVGALWMSDKAEIQMLLTVVTTIAGVLAGFISGRASAGRSPS